MAVHRNLIANYLGQAWVAVMGLAFIPFYIRYMGVEAFGMVGLYLSLQVLLMLLDMGLTPTMSREMARFSGGEHTVRGIHNLLRSVEVVVMSVIFLIVGTTLLAAPWIAGHWLQVQSIPLQTVTDAIGIIGAVVVLRMLEGIYRSCLIGLQQQVALNVAAA